MSLRCHGARSLVLLLTATVLVGCRSAVVQRQDSTPPFIFRSLDLHQMDPRGDSGWRLTSPEARYDIRRHLARASRPQGEILRNGRPLYRLSATSGTVINDGEVVLLEGRIEVRRLGPDPLVLQASRVRWLPGRQLMEIDRHPLAQDRHSRVVAHRARFLLDRQRLELRGQPQLQWRPLAVDPRQPSALEGEVLVDVSTVDWQLDSGALTAAGPVRGRRLGARTAGSAPLLQTLSAASLVGNTLQRRFSLAAPVQVVANSPQAQLQAQGLAIDVAAGTMETLAPQCVLLRPGERLEADRCRYNWGNQAFQAEGNVLYNRSANHQITRGALLEGRLGDTGVFRVTAPGSRVISQFQLPPRPPQAPQQERPKPPPIRL